MTLQIEEGLLTDELQLREFEVRRLNQETRTVSGLAVPYDTATNIGDFKEQVARGAFGTPDNVALFYGHSHRNGGLPIGRVTAFRDTEAGLEIDAVISDKTTQANEVYALLKDGILNRFSVGFEPVESRLSEDGTTVIRERAVLKEVSIVPMPAYEQAKVSAIRQEGEILQNKEVVENMTTNVETSENVAELREAVTDLERKFAGLQIVDTSAKPAGSQFRSWGEFTKALINGDEGALTEYRSYSGATTADTVVNDGWAGSEVRLVENTRKVLNAFSRGQWVQEGRFIEFGVLSSNTLAVASQGPEGTDLTSGKVVVVAGSAPKKTYGGYTQMSRQEINSASVNMLDISLRGLSIAYATTTNAAVRAALVAQSWSNTETLSANTAAGWLGLVIDAAADLEAEGVSPEFMMVSSNIFKKVGVLSDGSRPLVDFTSSGSNVVGRFNAPGLTGSLAGLPIIVDPGAADNTCYIAHSDAVRTYEEPGAPFKLADQNVINLTNTFSVAGDLAVGVTGPGLLVKCTVTAS